MIKMVDGLSQIASDFIAIKINAISTKGADNTRFQMKPANQIPLNED